MHIPPFLMFIKNPWPGRLISLDPGGTTGYAIWDNSFLVEAGQLPTHTVKGSVGMLEEWFDEKVTDFTVMGKSGVMAHEANTLVVMEEYRVYGHKTEDHAQSTMHTSRLIGAIESKCVRTPFIVGYVMQGAGMAKPFATDNKLKAWDFWQRGERHARDAIRHGVYWLCCGKPFDPKAITL